MASSVDGDVRLKVNFDTSTTGKSVNTLSGSLKQLGSLLNSSFSTGSKAQDILNAKAARTRESLVKLNRDLDELRISYERLKSGDVAPPSLAKMDADIAEAIKEFDKLLAQYDVLQARASAADIGVNTDELETARREFNSVSVTVEEAALRLDVLQARAERIRMNPELSDEALRLSEQIRQASDRLRGMGSNLNALDNATPFKNLQSAVKGTITEFGKMFKSAKNVFAKIGKIVKGVFGIGGKGLKKNKDELSAFGKFAARIFQNVRGIVLAAFLFDFMRDGVNSFVEYVQKAMSMNEQFVNSMQIIEGNLLTAFQPILDVVVPALVSLAGVLQRVTGYLALFMSILFGRDINVVSKDAKETSKEIDGIGSSAKGAAKELNRMQSGFDELFILQKESAGGGGGGGAEIKPPIFEVPELELPTWLADFTNALKDLDFIGAGGILADKLNQMVDGVDWDTIGKNIGTYIQRAFEMGFGFLDKIDAQKIGNGIAEFFNGIFGNVDPNLIGTTIGTFLNRAVDLAYGFFEKIEWNKFGLWLATITNSLFTSFDFEKLGASISLFVNGIANALYSYLTNVDWSMVTTQITSAVNSFFANTDWALVSTTISAFIVTLIQLLSGLIAGTDWALVGQSIATALVAIDWNSIFFSLLELISGILAGIGDLFVGLFGDENGPIVAAVASAVLLIGGILSAVTPLMTAFTTIAPVAKAFWDILMLIISAFSVISAPVLVVVAAIAVLTAAFVNAYQTSETFRDKVNAAVNMVGDTFTKWFGMIKIGFDEYIKPTFERIASKFKDISENSIAPMIENLTGLFSSLVDFISLVWTEWLDPFLTWLLNDFIKQSGSAFGFLADTIMIVFETIVEIVSNISLVLTGLIDFIVGTFTGDWQRAWDGVSGIFKGVINGIATILEGGINLIVRGLNAISFDVPEWIPLLGGKHFGFNIQSVTLPRLATGTVVPPNREFAAILGDNKREPEIVSPLSTMKQALTEALMEFGGMGGQNKIQLILDGRIVGEAVIDYINEKTDSTGISPIMI